MGSTYYMTVNGKIRSEQRSGEAHSRDYVLDPLGSVIQIYQNGWPIADACYEPYGGIYTQWNMEGKTFTWLGGWGYRQTGVEWSSVYVRARHYSRGLSNWTSIDPLWPSEMAYGYVEGQVMTGVDYWGREVTMLCNIILGQSHKSNQPTWRDRTFDCFWNSVSKRNDAGKSKPSDYKLCYDCATRNGIDHNSAWRYCERQFPPGKKNVFNAAWTAFLRELFLLSDCNESGGRPGIPNGCCQDIALFLTSVTAITAGLNQSSSVKACTDGCEEVMDKVIGRPPTKLEILQALNGCIKGSSQPPGVLDWLKALLDSGISIRGGGVRG